MNRKKKVMVAMSGGVDSSVAAALLLEEGYEVCGMTMLLTPPAAAAPGHEAPKHEEPKQEAPEQAALALPDAARDAGRVADHLGIAHYTVDFSKLFAEKVVDYFVEAYQNGRTPNPCVVCNRHVKFGALLGQARALGADYLATGHYVNLCYDRGKERYLLYRACYKEKDQSYVLYSLSQEQLSRALFPLGGYQKAEIRDKARALGLPVAEKRDSQEICFISDNEYRNFLTRRLGQEQIRPGNFVNSQGEVLGTHQGIPFYTVGQRKGLGLALGYPAFVARIDARENTVVLGRNEEVYQKELIAAHHNWIALAELTGPLEVEAKIRYSAPLAPAVITPLTEGRVLVRFKEPQRAITPGQAVVYYQDDLVVGGGTIEEVLP